MSVSHLALLYASMFKTVVSEMKFEYLLLYAHISQLDPGYSVVRLKELHSMTGLVRPFADRLIL